MSFWTWAIAAYARQGVSETCLELQDRHGQSVPFLLWAAWAAAEGRPLSQPQLREGATLAARWEEVAVGPLREVRRGLKTPVKGFSTEARQGVRERARAVELEAERVLIETLQLLVGGPSKGPSPLEPALVAAAAAWLTPAPPQTLVTLAERLG